MAYKSVFDYYDDAEPKFPLHTYLKKYPLSDKHRKWYEGLGFSDEQERDPRETAQVRCKMVEIYMRKANLWDKEDSCEGGAYSVPSFEQALTLIDDYGEAHRKPLLEEAIMEVATESKDIQSRLS